MSEVLSFWVTLIGAVVSDLFNYPITDNLTLGWFLLGCIIVEIVILFFFHRLIN